MAPLPATMADPRQVALSKAVARALRHEPWAYELELDSEGWVPIAQLLDALNRTRRWRNLDRRQLQAMVDLSAKRRYELAGDRIRALYGHSVPAAIARDPAQPPPVLFHGTARDVLDAITSDGLRPMRRQYVHLSVDRETAAEVGRRKERDPVLLHVDAAAASAAGVQFYRGNDVIWLTAHVPSAFLRTEHVAS